MAQERDGIVAKVHDIIAQRWSPRSFDADKPVEREKLLSILEAARWAPSCFGDEPWRYIVCDKFNDEPAWQRLLDCLAPKNQEWAQRAPILIMICANSQFHHNGKANRWADYDTGQASFSLCLQATALGMVSHQMGGFSADKVREIFNVPDSFGLVAVMAVGYQAAAEQLNEDFQRTELAERKRLPFGDCFYERAWGEGMNV